MCPFRMSTAGSTSERQICWNSKLSGRTNGDRMRRTRSSGKMEDARNTPSSSFLASLWSCPVFRCRILDAPVSLLWSRRRSSKNAFWMRCLALEPEVEQRAHLRWLSCLLLIYLVLFRLRCLARPSHRYLPLLACLWSDFNNGVCIAVLL